MLSLSEAIQSGRLAEFITQEEKRGIGPADRKKLDAAIRRLATQPQSEDRASRSSSGDGSTER
jgi:hypothetical protein